MLLPWSKRKTGPDGRLDTPPALISRRESLLQGTIGLAAALALAGCAAGEGESPQSAALEPSGDIGSLLEGQAPMVAGETLDAELLRRFYVRRGFEPVWDTRQAQANALKAAVLRARDHGLDPEMFHANLLRRMDMFPPVRRDLLLSHAVLTYAEALVFGAVPPERRKDGEALWPESVDVTEVLHNALDGPDPVAAIEALAPKTPTYAALRQALQRQRSAGIFDRTPASRLRLIEANLERQRWLPRELPADRVWVNVPDQQLVLYRDHRPVFVTRVVVGEATDRKQSPEFSTVIVSALFNPPWIIPHDIVEADIRPMLKQDPLYLVKNKITLLPNGEAKQAPGPQAGLGAVMFEMPNRFDVYLHDTPDKEAFGRDNRRISNGCIRVQNPLEFAALLMDEPMEAIQRKVAAGDTVRRTLSEPVPVFVLYHTAFASAGRDLEIRPDFYGRDEALWQRLQNRPSEQDLVGLGQMAAATSRSQAGQPSSRRSTLSSSSRSAVQRRS
ncbi:MAG: L,D-transpeptidase family protein [Roseomonas sp.]|nr:L,D-transpeptidase family protein [Roseomonas sp.]MCA3326234.1 L,D-transpeptidase family protein [Roseomonas sp.]MCA3330339.1 L,D-transpeptidase family protein [Roseomonas sp.]MCA3335210.1 L,D-transpeptidase family protein [Roseomonas sp.]MCA3355359.1 L,D-transpeptidase family protein [Roseomonas sp.]